MSFTKPEVHNVSQRSRRRTDPRLSWGQGIDRQTDRQTSSNFV